MPAKSKSSKVVKKKPGAKAPAAAKKSGAKPSKPSTPVIGIDTATGELDVSGAVALFSALQKQLAAHKPSPGAVAFWAGLIGEDEAKRDGITISSDRVIADAMIELAALVPHLLEGGLPGYGPKRAYYAVSLALDHARAYASFLEVEAKRATASESKSGSIQDARRGRAHLQGLLAEAAYGDSSLQAGIAKAASPGAKRPAQVSASLQGLTAIAQNVLKQSEGQPGMAEALADMGLTPVAVANAAKQGQQIATATSAHAAQRTAHREESDVLNVFDGQVWFELDALERSVARARNEGRKVPEVKLANIGRVHRRRTAGEPAPAATPAVPAAPAVG